MFIWSLMLSLLFFKSMKAESFAQNGNFQPTDSADSTKPDASFKAKFNFTTNGSFSGEFGKAINGQNAESGLSQPETPPHSLVDPNKQLLKELIANLLNSKLKSRFAKRNSDNGMLVGFRPFLNNRNIPFKAPKIFGFTDKCVVKNRGCWCKEYPVTMGCTWETDCYCLTTVTCGPTKPAIEHAGKWCAEKPDAHSEERTPLPCLLSTIPFCTTTGATGAATFTPPCFNPTPHTQEPCVCPTTLNVPTCPCPPARFREPDLFSFLVKRAAGLPGPLRNETIAFLGHHLRKRSAV